MCTGLVRRARARSCPQWAPCPSGAPPSISAGGRASASREPCLLCPPHEATGPSDESDHSHPGVRTCREDARGSARNLIATHSFPKGTSVGPPAVISPRSFISGFLWAMNRLVAGAAVGNEGAVLLSPRPTAWWGGAVCTRTQAVAAQGGEGQEQPGASEKP